MTSGGFLTCEPMVLAFGANDIKNKAAAIRKAWPDALPKGKERITNYQAAYFVYVFASTEGILETAKRIWSAAYSHNSEIQKSAVIFIGDLIAHSGTTLSEDFLGNTFTYLTISKRTGIMTAYFSDGKHLQFVPELKGTIPIHDVEDFTVIKKEFFMKLGPLFEG
jgi:hypothetical protein